MIISLGMLSVIYSAMAGKVTNYFRGEKKTGKPIKPRKPEKK